MKSTDYRPENYTAALRFIRELRQYRNRLTRQQIHTLRGQAIAGDVDGAVRGLGKLLLETGGTHANAK